MRATTLLAPIFALSLQSQPAEAEAPPTPKAKLSSTELVAALREGGLVIHFRHAKTESNQKDSSKLDSAP